MDALMQMFEELPRLMQMFWVCAIVGSIVMVIQLILSVVGIGDFDVDVDADISAGDGLDASTGADLFTIKNLVNFVVGFGWGGVTLRPYVESDSWLLLWAVVVGLLFVLIFVFVYKKMMKLESNGAVGASACVGKMAEVYIRIPAARAGKGKIMLSLNGAAREFDAITDSADTIPTGTMVVVDEVIDGTILLVRTK